MQPERAVLVDNSVSGVIAALKSDYEVCFGCEIIYNASFAFVAELRSDDYGARHTISPSLRPNSKFKV